MNNLVTYRATIHVPDTENQGNYNVSGQVWVDVLDQSEIEGRVKKWIMFENNCDEVDILDLELTIPKRV